MQMQEVIEKLKDILASEGKNNLKTKDIAKELGIHPDTFNSMKFRNSIPYAHILNFLEKRNISINYFFYGSSPKDQLECEYKYKILKLYKTNASLGGGGINDILDFENILIDQKILDFFKTKDCELITCYGESMEPIIKDRSIYVVNTKDGLFIKQVLKQDNGVILHSLNPLYKDISNKSLKEIWNKYKQKMQKINEKFKIKKEQKDLEKIEDSYKGIYKEYKSLSINEQEKFLHNLLLNNK